MEYVVFTVIVAAGGAMIAWFGIRTCKTTAMNGSGRVRLAPNGLPEEPPPPRKSVIGGPTAEERRRREFEDRMDSIQRAYRHRVNGFRGSVPALEGRKYTFVPGPRRGNPAAGSA